jgi:hypothetical protein
MANQAKSRAGYIYILQPHVLIDGESVIKIGATTRTVAARVRELQQRSMVALDLVYSIAVDNPRLIEQQINARYADQRLAGGGEGFFHMTAEEIIPEIEELVIGSGLSPAKRPRHAEPARRQKASGSRSRSAMRIASHIIWFLATAVLGIGAIVYLPFEIPVGMEGYVLVAFLAVAAFIVKLGMVLAKYLSSTHLFSRRFTAGIGAKDAALHEKYPSA